MNADDRAEALQREINRLADGLDVDPMPVGRKPRSNDDLSIFVDDDGTYQVLSHYNPTWGRRKVRELAAKFRAWGRPQDIALLPDIGEPV